MDIELMILLQLHLFFIFICSSSLSQTPPHSYPPSNHLLCIPPYIPLICPGMGRAGRSPSRAEEGAGGGDHRGSREEKKKREEKAVAGAVQPHRSHHRRPAFIPPVSVTVLAGQSPPWSRRRRIVLTESLFCRFPAKFWLLFRPSSAIPSLSKNTGVNYSYPSLCPGPDPSPSNPSVARKWPRRSRPKKRTAVRHHIARTIPDRLGLLRPIQHVEPILLAFGEKPSPSHQAVSAATRRKVPTNFRRYTPTARTFRLHDRRPPPYYVSGPPPVDHPTGDLPIWVVAGHRRPEIAVANAPTCRHCTGACPCMLASSGQISVRVYDRV